jgi:hypothetical protein
MQKMVVTNECEDCRLVVAVVLVGHFYEEVGD